MNRRGFLSSLGCLALLMSSCRPGETVNIADGVKWDRIGNYCYRTRTPNGWLVLYGDSGSSGKACCFVPDAEHAWAAK